MNWTEEKINQTITDIKKKSSKDETFRKLCLDHPHEAIKQISGMEVLEGVKINIIENESGIDQTIILPSSIAGLSKMELDYIEGGRLDPSCVYYGCGAHHIQ